MSTIYQIVMVALVSAFIELTASKTGLRYRLRDWCDQAGFGAFAEMLECDFCFGFWLSMLVSVILVFITLDPAYMCIPIFASPLIRLLV